MLAFIWERSCKIVATRLKTKTAYIIPGYKENGSEDHYVKLVDVFKRRNIKAVVIKIHWKHRTFSSYVSDVLAEISDAAGKSILLGFSFGAIVALLIAPLLSLEKLYLCSLSPFFKEDITANKVLLKSLGKRRAREMQEISFVDQTRQITCSTNLIVGSEEDPAVIQRTCNAAKLIELSQLSIVDGARHCLCDAAYFCTLKKMILQ